MLMLAVGGCPVAWIVGFTVTGFLFIFIEINKDSQFYQLNKNEELDEEMKLRIAGQQVDKFLNTNNSKYISLMLPNCGGMCNMFYRYLSIYGIGRSIGRLPFIDEKVKCFKRTMPEFSYAFPNLYKALKFMKPNGKRAVSFGMNCCKYDNVTRLKQYEDEEFLYVKGNLLQAYQYFHPYKNEIRYLLDFSQEVKNHAHEYADNLFGNDTSTHKFCVHIRRGDFIKHFLLESRYNFTNPAIEFVGRYLEEKHSNISIVLLGLDMNFMKGIQIPENLFHQKYFAPTQNRTSDLYFASHFCDSLLMTASGSTFAWWIAYLGNMEVFYNIETAKKKNFGKNIYDYDSFLPKWKRLKLTENSTIEFEPKWHRQIKRKRT